MTGPPEPYGKTISHDYLYSLDRTALRFPQETGGRFLSWGLGRRPNQQNPSFLSERPPKLAILPDRRTMTFIISHRSYRSQRTAF